MAAQSRISSWSLGCEPESLLLLFEKEKGELGLALSALAKKIALSLKYPALVPLCGPQWAGGSQKATSILPGLRQCQKPACS